MIIPHDHQEKAIRGVLRAWNSPFQFKHTTLGVAPTGSGKSIIMLSAFERFMEQKGRKMRCVMLAHTLAIIESLYEDALKYDFDSVGLVNGDKKEWHKQVMIGTPQSFADDLLMRRMDFIGTVDVLFIDEAHRGITNTHLKVYRKLKKMNPDLLVLGATATYDRTDMRGLRQLFTHCCFRVQPKTLIRKKKMAKPKFTWLLRDNEPGYVASWWQRTTKGKRKTIVFCESVYHARQMFGLFDDLGQDVALITGDTSREERKQAYESHVIVSVDVLKEGANVPGVSCIVIARNAAETPWRQMIGRGTRPDSKDCKILAMNKYKVVKKIPRFVLGIPRIEGLPIRASRVHDFVSRFYG